MNDGLARILAAAFPASDPEQLAEAIWLAARTPRPEYAHEPVPDGPAPEETSPDKTEDGAPAGELPAAKPAAELALPVGDAEPLSPGGAPVTEVGLGLPAKAPTDIVTTTALSLFRRVHRAGLPVVDVDATVEATADARRLVVVTRSGRERGLDVAVVVDRTTVALAWSETVDELERTLRRSGAFRAVTRWTVDRAVRAVSGEPLVHDTAEVAHQAAQLVDPAGRRLVLFLSDGTGDGWRHSGMWTMLRRWAAAMPTALVHLLPQSHWGYTTVGPPAGVVRSGRPAEPNASLDSRTAWWSDDDISPADLPVPVLELEPESILRWTRAIVSGSPWNEAIWTRPRAGLPEPAVAPSAADRLRTFEMRASPGAQQLAHILAGAPLLSLPLIKVLHEHLVDRPATSQIAELLVSGLLERTPESTGSGDTLMRFLPDVPELLYRGTTVSEEWDIYELLTGYLERHARAGDTVRAAIADPNGITSVNTFLTPFASMGARMAQRLGLILDEAVPDQPGSTRASSPITEQQLVVHHFAALTGPDAARAVRQLNALWQSFNNSSPSEAAFPSDPASAPEGILAARTNPQLGFRTVVRREADVLTLSLMMDAFEVPSDTSAWPEHTRWWEALSHGNVDALLGGAILYLATGTAGATPSVIRAAIPAHPDDADGWWNRGLDLGGFPCWEVTASPGPGMRRLAVLTGQDDAGALDRFIWGEGSPEMAPLGRYLMDAAKLRAHVLKRGDGGSVTRLQGEATGRVNVLAQALREPVDLEAVAAMVPRVTTDMAEIIDALQELTAVEFDVEVIRDRMETALPRLLPTDEAILGHLREQLSGDVDRLRELSANAERTLEVAAAISAVVDDRRSVPDSPAGTRIGFAVDVIQFGARPDRRQREVRERFMALVERVFAGLGVNVGQAVREDRGDGMLVVLPPGLAEHRVLPDLLRIMSREVEADNTGHPRDRIRLRLSVGIGRFPVAASGPAGSTIVELARLLDSSTLHNAANSNPEADVVALVTDRLYRDVFDAGSHERDRDQFEVVDVEVKSSLVRAWLWIDAATPLRRLTRTAGEARSDVRNDERVSASVSGLAPVMTHVGNADVNWDEFDPEQYFVHNYAILRRDDARIIEIVASFFARTVRGRKLGDAVDVGTGPNLYPAMLMLPFAGRVILLDRGRPSREWLNQALRQPQSSWDLFWHAIADGRPEYATIARPMAVLADRAVVAKGNLFSLQPDQFDLGTMFFGAESVTTRNDEFRRATQQFVGSLKRGAPFAAAFMRESNGYLVNGTSYPACPVTERDVEQALAPVSRQLNLDVVGDNSLREGYGGMIVATGRKK
ncbi:hypothetical protein Aab01nite_50240 [Paractinoplanes abujensis]|uniref:Uncharacterized protein n=1 Tax=Paractinoplanes abujensis TaxID=882441 RepID=A0A7W7G381_9ACTN|nr:SCO2525 family SAM-dependent methyltransferase [Actinoplanes abujensis]MBB4693910.1 hypothetical protein [Actinoplanes abujensis]GID21434.1 hypothetical protein Aab01nite_50240 [Actinoplanes abujensis]